MEVVGQREGKKCEHRWGDPGTPHRVSRGAWWGGGTTTLAFTILFKGKVEGNGALCGGQEAAWQARHWMPALGALALCPHTECLCLLPFPHMRG